MTGFVRAIFRTPAHRAPMERLGEAAVAADGIEGDRYAGGSSIRQVLLFDAEIASDLRIREGDVRENFTLEGVGVQGLASGTRLRVGDAVLELTDPCAPCGRMNEVRAGLKDELRGRRGVYARVVRPGVVREGDEVSVDG